jgi:hypothetical protein
MRIARVFPRRTAATPDDELAFTSAPPKRLPDIDEVHISVAFSYDMEKAEELAEQWSKTGVPVKFGGPARGEAGGEFVPGRYLKKGYVITSRGCANRCWFCAVPKREGGIVRELKITEGHLLLDDNLLQCSESHIRAVFEMLARQKETPRLTGGLEARLLKEWHVELIRKARVKRMYFAYDTPDDYEPLIEAGKLLRACGVSRASHGAVCYVLIGYEGDTFLGAEKRLRDAWTAGFLPFAMLYRGEDGKTDESWRKFQRVWVRPQIVVKQLS